MTSNSLPLRGYQRKAIDAIIKAWNRNIRPMVSIATGGGKTVILAELIVNAVKNNGRALVVAHTEEIVRQVKSTIEKKYNGSVGVVMGNEKDYEETIIVATRQSLGEKALNGILSHGEITVVVIDEAHHATTENTYGDIIDQIEEHNEDMRLVGFTATPTRMDQQGTDEEGDLFDEIVFSWSMKNGVQSGILVPAYQIFAQNMNYRDSSESIADSKDWLNQTFKVYKKYIAAFKRPCLAFFSSVAKSRQFTRKLKKNGIKAAHIDGTTPKEERSKIISDYRNGKIQVVSNMEVLTEGFDAPHTSAILVVRKIRSKSLFTQIVGRGLRQSKGKKDCLIINLSKKEDSFQLKDLFD